jgi:hypothetical protein
MREVMRDLGFIKFDGRNEDQKYGYASAAGIIHKLQDALVKHGIVLETRSELVRFEEAGSTRAGSAKFMAVVKKTVIFRLGDESLSSEGHGAGVDAGDKAAMKAETAANKYAIAHAFSLAWGAVDPEEDSPTVERKTKSSDPVSLTEAIRSCKSDAELSALRGAVSALKASSDYESLKSEFLKKKESFNGKA